MLYIPKFAKEIGLDSISFQKLRIEKFSPLKEVVEATPGYYYQRIGGPVYSDRSGRKELKRIRNRIRAEFYTCPSSCGSPGRPGASGWSTGGTSPACPCGCPCWPAA